MPDRVVDPDELYLIGWNPHAGNSAKNILGRLDDEAERERPGVIALCEVWRHLDDLEAWAKRNDYRLYMSTPRPRPDGRPIPGEGDVALLLDEEALDIRKHRRVRMTREWTVFSHDQRRGPRVYERAWFRTPGGRRWKLTASHWPTNGFEGGNRVAFSESTTEAMRALLRRRPFTIGVDYGDHNESVTRLREWASRVLPGAVVVGHGPDSVIALGATAEGEVGPKDGSDHHLLRIRLTPRRARWWGRQ